MGFFSDVGDFFKSAASIILPIVGFFIAGPIGSAIGSAIGTAINGGSFTEILISAAISGATAFASQALAGSFESFATAGIGETAGGFTSVVDPITGLIDVVPTSSIIDTIGSTLGTAATSNISALLQPAVNIFSEATSAFGVDTAFSVFNALQSTTIASLGGAVSGIFAGLTLREALLSPDIEGVDAALEEAGVSTDKIAALRTEARKAQLAEVFDRVVGTAEIPATEAITTGGQFTEQELRKALEFNQINLNSARAEFNEPPLTSEGEFDSDQAELFAARGPFSESRKAVPILEQIANIQSHLDANVPAQALVPSVPGDTQIPLGLSDEEFKRIIASGILNRDTDLGPGATQIDFNSVFGGPGLGADILLAETGARRDAFLGNIETSFADFPGDLFNPLSDDDIINIILDERQAPVAQQISVSEARGNLNPFGGKSANAEIANQRGVAETRLQDIGGSVLSSNLLGLQDIQTRAEQGARSFNLGDPLFDLTPFETERSEFIGEKTSGLETDIRTALGGEALFSAPGAIQAGGRLQGVVSGVPKTNRLLDAIAAREEESEAARRGKRGLGVAGSGAF